jgi:hypothetical protein
MAAMVSTAERIRTERSAHAGFPLGREAATRVLGAVASRPAGHRSGRRVDPWLRQLTRGAVDAPLERCSR